MEPFKAVNTWLGKQYHLFIFLKRRAVPKVTAGTPGSADIAATLPRLPISGPLPLGEMSLERGSEKPYSSNPSLSRFEPTILKQRSHAQWPELRMPKATQPRRHGQDIFCGFVWQHWQLVCFEAICKNRRRSKNFLSAVKTNSEQEKTGWQVGLI